MAANDSYWDLTIPDKIRLYIDGVLVLEITDT